MYFVLSRFADLLDNNRIYEAGDDYPRPGLDVTPERLAELAGSDNRTGRPLIKRVEAPETPVEASESAPKDLLAEPQKPAKKPVRSRKKG